MATEAASGRRLPGTAEAPSRRGRGGLAGCAHLALVALLYFPAGACSGARGTSNTTTRAVGAATVTVEDPLLAPCPAPNLRKPVAWFARVAARMAETRDRLGAAAAQARSDRDPLRYACFRAKGRAAGLVAERAARLAPGIVRLPREPGAPAALLALCEEARRLWSEARHCPGGPPPIPRTTAGGVL